VPLAAGSRLGPYEIVSPIGAGGMGEVYRARDTRLGREVAIKVLPADRLADQARRARFEQEARAVARLNHPNIVTIHEIESAEGIDFIVMELVPGKTLDALIPRQGMRLGEALRIAIPLADALAAAHAAGIVHRDLKPANVMVTPEGVVKVLDFGLAKLMQTDEGGSEEDTTLDAQAKLSRPGMVAGTPAYMSPEQASGGRVDARSDVFAFGAMLYEVATGRQAFSGNTSAVILDAILNREPMPPSRLNPALPAELERIVNKAVEKDRELRYQTAADLRADLKRLKRDLDLGRVQAGEVSRARDLSERQHKAVAGRIKAIAVLPLTNLSRDPEEEYFVDGMTEALITDLAQIGALRVISRSSAMRYKGTDKPLPEIARELSVDGFLEGSVLRVGDRVRITAQLIHAATDQHLWAKSYERDLRDVLALQSEVARAIVEEVHIKLTPQQHARLARSRVVNPVAHEAYLKGRYHWARAAEQSLRKSVEYFQEAIARDPSYAPAYCGLSDAYNFLSNPILEAVPQGEVMPKAKAAVTRALELDDTLADAHVSLGRIKFYFDWDWVGAEKAFQRAIELNPNQPYAHYTYALVLGVMERHTEALGEVRRAQESDPVSLLVNSIVGLVYVYARQFQKAEEQFRKTLELDFDFAFARWMFGGLCLVPLGRYDEAIAELQKAVALEEDLALPRGLLGYAYAKVGRKDEARRVLEELEELSRQRHVTPMARAFTYTGLGDERMFDALEEAFQQRSTTLIWAGLFPHWDDWRAHPRYQELLHRMNLPQS